MTNPIGIQLVWYTDKVLKILKTSKEVSEAMFFNMQNNVYSERVFNTLYIEINYRG